MKTTISKIKSFFVLLYADWQLHRAIKVANQKHQKFQKRFYVVPDARHKLVSRSWSDLKKMRKAGLFSAHASESSFILESFYYTPNKFGQSLAKQQQKKKRKAWLNYIAQAKKLA